MFGRRLRRVLTVSKVSKLVLTFSYLFPESARETLIFLFIVENPKLDLTREFRYKKKGIKKNLRIMNTWICTLKIEF